MNNNNNIARYFTRRDITLISEMESKVVSVDVQRRSMETSSGLVSGGTEVEIVLKLSLQ
jgi:hypothetical protein